VTPERPRPGPRPSRWAPNEEEEMQDRSAISEQMERASRIIERGRARRREDRAGRHVRPFAYK